MEISEFVWICLKLVLIIDLRNVLKFAFANIGSEKDFRLSYVLALSLAGSWPQPCQPLDVIYAVFHSAVGDGEHQILLLLCQKPCSFLDFCRHKCRQVAVEIIKSYVLGGADPMLLLPDVRAHLQNAHIDFMVLFIDRVWATSDRIDAKRLLFLAVGIVKSFLYL